MIATLKVLSILLNYPTREVTTAVGELREAIDREALLVGKPRAALDPLLGALDEKDLYELQEDYVFLFDRTKSLSLHLFEHVHGEGRDRGQAMVDLKRVYEEAGFDFATNELPDFIPAYLEFLSTLGWDEARDYLLQPLHIFEALRKRLEDRETPYAALFAALEALADGSVSAEAVAELLSVPTEDPNDLEALDEAWEDAAVEFGAGAALADACPASRDMLNRMAVPPQDGGQTNG